MQRGFSLFTPLVGTAIIVLAIAISVTMMQNDARIARGLSRSYEVSGQELTAKMITATVEASILAAFEERTTQAMTYPYFSAFQCGEDKEYCKSSIIKNTYLSAMQEGIARGIMSKIREALQNVLGDDYTADEDAMSDYLRSHQDEWLSIAIETKGINETMKGPLNPGIFYVNFSDNMGNKMSVKVATRSVYYYFEPDVGDFIDSTADIFYAAKNTAADADYATNAASAISALSLGRHCAGSRSFNSITLVRDATTDYTRIDSSWKLIEADALPLSIESGAKPADAAASVTLACDCSGETFSCA